MNLNHIVDIVITYLYSNPNALAVPILSDLLIANSIPFNGDNSKLICDKIKRVDLCDYDEISTTDSEDLILVPNDKGYEFYQQYGSYSNFLILKEKEESRAKTAAERGSKGSYWSGIGALIAIPLSLGSLIFSIYSYYQTNRQSQINAQTTSTLKSLKTQVKSISKSSYKPPKSPAKRDSLVGLKRK